MPAGKAFLGSDHLPRLLDLGPVEDHLPFHQPKLDPEDILRERPQTDHVFPFEIETVKPGGDLYPEDSANSAEVKLI
jgi:hypothetical protein